MHSDFLSLITPSRTTKRLPLINMDFELVWERLAAAFPLITL